MNLHSRSAILLEARRCQRLTRDAMFFTPREYHVVVRRQAEASVAGDQARPRAWFERMGFETEGVFKSKTDIHCL